jgi:hypothetical protein
LARPDLRVPFASGEAGGFFTSRRRTVVDAGKKGSDEPLGVLRAKYHDYCSAQVADLLVYMSPDEIYLLAHRAYREQGGEGDISYVEMVRVATDWLSRRMALPPFDVWLEDYREHPERYEEYFIGLWESETEGGTSSSESS